jgi:type IV pilus assembly protein PilM
MAYTSNSNGRPRVGCEISADRVIAARVASGQRALDVYATRRFPSGTVQPGLGAANVLQPEALRQAVGGALEAVAGNQRDILLVIPDAAVRVLLLDFDDLPSDPDEASAVIRFRGRKSVPFDADHAALAFQVDRSRRPVKVVAAFSPREVIAEYERAVTESGFNAGFVLPSIVSTLGLIDVTRPTLIVKVDGMTSTVSIVDANRLVLLRTIEVPGRSVLTLQDITSNVLPSMVFFEDTYSAKIDRVIVTGDAELNSLAEGLAAEAGVQVEALSTTGFGGGGLGDPLPPALLAPIAGGLLG